MTLKDRWACGEITYGVWSALDDPAVAELLGRSGFDLVCVDLQHGLADLSSARNLLRALHGTPAASAVRVPWNAPEQIQRVLDLGAEVVVVPMVSTPEEARRAAEACRYGPSGRRSWGPVWGDVRRGFPEAEEGDRTATCVVMIETAEGLANAAEIARVPGVDALYVGPNDLALSLGLGRPDYGSSRELHEAVDAVAAAGRAAGVAVGFDGVGTEAARYWAERGMSLVITARDTVLLRRAVDDAAAELA